jgi:hypothetical protein
MGLFPIDTTVASPPALPASRSRCRQGQDSVTWFKLIRARADMRRIVYYNIKVPMGAMKHTTDD